MAKIDQIIINDTTYQIVPEIAPLFDPGENYATGSCVIHNAILYRFTSAHAAGTWNSNEVETFEVGEKLTEIQENIDNQISDLKQDLNKMNTATSEDVGKTLKAKTVDDGKVTEWEFGEAGGGIITPDNISMADVEQETELEITFEDGKYSRKYWTVGDNANMSVTTAAVPNDSKILTYTTFQAPTSDIVKAQFLLENGDVKEVNATSYSQVSTRLYIVICDVPIGATSFRSTIYTSEKSNAFVKVSSNQYFTPAWLGLRNGIIDADAMNSNAVSSKTALEVTFEDGYYTVYTGTPDNVTGYTNHASNASMSIATIDGITPLTLYEIDSYYNPALTAGGFPVWYDANGIRITDENDKPYNYILESNVVYKNNSHFRQIVMAPLRAAYVKITVALANKSECVFNEITLTRKQLAWLSVGIRNLDSQCINLIAQSVFDQINAKDYDYHTVVDKAVSINSKSTVLFGDSIAAGVASGTTDSNFKSWANIVKTRFGLTLTNQAVSGKTIVNDNSDSNSISAKVSAYSGSDNVAIIAGGTNDHTLKKTLGVWGDTTASTFYGALYVICEHLKTLNFEKVVFVTPINKSQRYDNPISLDQYREAIQITARYYGFDVIEGKDFGFPTGAGVAQMLFLYDNLHPTQAGHAMYANNMCNYLA